MDNFITKKIIHLLLRGKNTL